MTNKWVNPPKKSTNADRRKRKIGSAKVDSPDPNKQNPHLRKLVEPTWIDQNTGKPHSQLNGSQTPVTFSAIKRQVRKKGVSNERSSDEQNKVANLGVLLGD